MKDINDCENFDEIDIEYANGIKRFRELLAVLFERQQSGDMRLSYTGLKELIEAMEVNEFILENTDTSRSIKL